MLRRHLLLLSGLATLLATAPAQLQAQTQAQTYPDRPVRLIVPFPPGGSADPIGRLIAGPMEKLLGQPVVVENRSGAGGIIGTDAVAKAAPDGYTIGLVGVGSMTVVQHLLPEMAYKAERDLMPVMLAVGVPQLLVASKALKVATVQEAMAKARAAPGQLTYASSGNGNSPHLAMASFMLRSGLQLVHVPYRGVAPAITDLMGGRVDLMFADLPALAAPARDGSIVPLAVGGAEPSALLPGVPTLDQAGVKGVDVENWYGIVAPRGTPQDRVQSIHQAASAALAMPETRQRLQDLGVRIIGSGPEDFARHLERETAKWAALIREARITLE